MRDVYASAVKTFLNIYIILYIYIMYNIAVKRETPNNHNLRVTYVYVRGSEHSRIP